VINQTAVANDIVMPKRRLRPREPGQHSRDAHYGSAGLASSFNATVAMMRMMPRMALRPREPGQTSGDAHINGAGLALFQPSEG
jgi:hypothetical protein